MDGTEDTLYTDTLTAATFGANGDKLTIRYTGNLVASATATRILKAYVAGTVVATSATQTINAAASWTIDVTVIRVSSSVLRVSATVDVATAVAGVGTSNPTYTEITSLTLANTQIIKCTGIAAGTGAGVADIVARMASINFTPVGSTAS